MKKLMAQLKKGNAISEIFTQQEEPEKHQRLQDLKNQRQMLDVSDYKSSIKKSMEDINELRKSVKDESVLQDLDVKEK